MGKLAKAARSRSRGSGRLGAPGGRRCGRGLGAATFPERRSSAASRRAVLPKKGAPPPRRLSRQPSPRVQGLPCAPVTRPLPSGPLLRGPPFPAGSEGSMEQAAGPLRNALSGRVLESKALEAPADCGPRAEPQAPLGDRVRVPHPAPEPPPCAGGTFLSATFHPEERRALGVQPESASSALAAPGQPRDSARWMLCVAEAKLKVSGVWARSSVSAGGSLWLRRAQGGLALQGSLSVPGGRLLLPTRRCE